MRASKEKPVVLKDLYDVLSRAVRVVAKEYVKDTADEDKLGRAVRAFAES